MSGRYFFFFFFSLKGGCCVELVHMVVNRLAGNVLVYDVLAWWCVVTCSGDGLQDVLSISWWDMVVVGRM